MALTLSLTEELGKTLPAFNLKGVDGKFYSHQDYKDKKGLLVVFMCNHCPYVIATQDRINALTLEYAPQGVAVIGINSNDAKTFPEDNFEAMQARSKEAKFVFPYLFDETQTVAKDFNAVCTPDPFLFRNSADGFKLFYHGRIDNNWKDASKVTKYDLKEALDFLLSEKIPPQPQVPAMGCSIKWA